MTVLAPLLPPVVVVFFGSVGMSSAAIDIAESVWTITKWVEAYFDAPFPKS